MLSSGGLTTVEQAIAFPVRRAEEQRVIQWAASADFSIPALLALRRVRH